MSHYWTADDPPETRQAQLEDWIEDLVEFPIEVVDAACREWRRTQTKRPLSAQIRDLAIQEHVHRQRLTKRLSPPAAANQPGRYIGPEGRCQDDWPSCSERWHTRGMICQPECRDHIPDYRTLTEEEAERRLGANGKRQHNIPEIPWRYRVAAAYRWAFDNGRPMPNENLSNESQRVHDLVVEYEAQSLFAEQDRERVAARNRIVGSGKNSDGTPTSEAIAYVELCSRQVAANMKQFYDRNAQALREPRATPVSPQPAPKREPNYPDTRGVEELLASLGVRATEQKR